MTREKGLLEALLPYRPKIETKLDLKRTRDDWRIFGGWYTTLKLKGKFKYSKDEILNTFLIPCLNELIREGSTEFHPENWKKYSKEIYLEAFDKVVTKFRYLVEPHAELIYKRKKTATVHARKFIQGAFVSIVGPGYEFGYARFEDGKEINLKEFVKFRDKHKVKDEEREKWWPGKEELFFYPIRTWIPLEKPRHVRIPKGIQTYGERARLNEGWELDESRHRKDRCMKCAKPPDYDVLWANAMGRAWFCTKHFKEWIGEMKADSERTGYALDVDGVKKVDNGIVTDKWADNRNSDLKKNLNRIMKEQRQKINSPTFAYMTVYGKEPKEFLRGRTDAPKKMWRGNDVDKDLKDKWLEDLNGIKGIEIRSSDAGKSVERIAFVVIRFSDKGNDGKAKGLSAKLANEEGVYSKSDIGMEGRPRICVAGKIWKGQKNWKGWWEGLAEKIEKCVKETMTESFDENVDLKLYEPDKLKDLTDEELLEKREELITFFEERGSREGDELVINAYQFLRDEMTRRELVVEKAHTLDRLTASLQEGKLDKFLIEKAKQIHELGQIIWKDRYVSLTGSCAFVENRLPNDLDTVFKDDEVNKGLLLKVDRIFEKYFGVESCPIPEPSGPNWRNLPLWDLALVPTKELKFIEMNEPGFIEQFYESLGLKSFRGGTEKFKNEAAASLREDKILLGRYFLTLKPTRPAVPEERMTLESLLKYFKEDDFPANVEKKYDGANHVFFKNGEKVTIVSEDGEDNTARLPKTVEAVRKLKAKTAMFLGELEAWEGKKHLPREVISGYLHSHSKPDDSHVITNVYGVIFLEGEDLHKKSEVERRAALEKMGWPQATVDEPDLKYRLNLAPIRTAKNTGELKASVTDLRKRPGSEGVVVKKHKAVYYLDRNSRNGWFKLHNTGILKSIVIEIIETRVRGVYNYRYGIDQGKYKVKPGDLSEVKDREWMEVGKTFSTEKKVGRGEVIEVEFETLNFIRDERSGTVKITAWVPRFMKPVAGKPDSVDAVVSEARKNLILREKTITKDGRRIYEELMENVKVEYLNEDEYKEWLHEAYGIERKEVGRLLKERTFIEEQYDWSPNEEELKEAERKDAGFGAALRRAGTAAKKLPRFSAVIQNHFRGKSSHKDFRVKMNDHLRGWTIMDQPEGAVTEDVETIEDGRRWQKQVTWKFRPDMDPITHVVAIRKAKQPTIWIKWDDSGMGRYAAAPPGSVGATRFEWGVIVQEDAGYAYLTVKKPYFEEYFLNMKHYKGRMVIRLIGVGEKWKKPPKGKLQWQTWFNLKEQTPYLLTRRARMKRDYIPDGVETTASGLPPEWEEKIPHMLRWWGRKLSRSEKLDRMDQAFNYLAEKGELKARPLKRVEEAMGNFTVRRHWWRGQIVVRAMPVQHWDLLLDTGKDYLEEFNLEKDPLIAENLERGIPAYRKKVRTGTPKGGNFRDWMKWEGSIPPGHPEWGNPNKRIPAHMKILEQGKMNVIEASEMFISLEFKGKALKGYVTLKRESPGAAVWVMRRGALPGERRKEQYFIEEEEEHGMERRETTALV